MAERNIPEHIEDKLAENSYIRVPEVGKSHKLYFYILTDGDIGYKTEEQFVSTIMATEGPTGFALTPRSAEKELGENWILNVQRIGSQQTYSQDAQEFGSWFYEKTSPVFRSDFDLQIFERLFVVTIDEPFSVDEDGQPNTPVYAFEANNKEDVNGSFNAGNIVLKKIRPYIAKKTDGVFVFFVWTEQPIQPANWRYQEIETTGFTIWTKFQQVDNYNNNIDWTFEERPNAFEMLTTWITSGNLVQLYPLWVMQYLYLRDTYGLYRCETSDRNSIVKVGSDGVLDSGSIVNYKNCLPEEWKKWTDAFGPATGDQGASPFYAQRNILVGSSSGGETGYTENSLLTPKETNIIQTGLTPSYPTTSYNGTLPRNNGNDGSWNVAVEPLFLIDTSTTFQVVPIIAGDWAGATSNLYFNNVDRSISNGKSQNKYIGTTSQVENWAGFLKGNYGTWNTNPNWSGFPDVFEESNNPAFDFTNMYGNDLIEASKGLGLVSAKDINSLQEVVDIPANIGEKITQIWTGPFGQASRVAYSNPNPYKETRFKNNAFFTEATNDNLKLFAKIDAGRVVEATNQFSLTAHGGYRWTIRHYDENRNLLPQTLTFRAPNLLGNARNNNLTIVFGSTRKDGNLLTKLQKKIGLK